ncbi:unnamed protein product, partial [Mesorhabditis spiculigera]
MAFVPFDYLQPGWPMASTWIVPQMKDAPDMHYHEVHKAHVGKGNVTETPRRYSVSLDVHEFAPSELEVKTEGRKVVVKGTHLEAEDKYGREFKRKYKLPRSCELESIESHINPEGVLMIETKKRDRSNSTNVPIIRETRTQGRIIEHF